MRTVYKHFKYICEDCGNLEQKLFDVSKEDDIITHKKCSSCGKETLKLQLNESQGSSAAIIGEGDRWTKKLDPDFKYMMKNMKKRHPRANIPDY